MPPLEPQTSPLAAPSGNIEGGGGPQGFRPMSPIPFGGRTAIALDEASQGATEAGKNIFEVVQAKQGIKNELTAQAATTDYMKQATAEFGKYSQLEGKAAQDALPAFQDRLQALWQSTMSSMPNPDAQRMLAPQTRWYLNRFYMMAQDHADTQARKYADDLSQSARDEYGSQFVLNMGDQKAADLQLGLGEQEIIKNGEVHGWDAVQTQHEISLFRGKWVAAGVKLLVDQDNPNAAADLLEHYKGTMDARYVLQATAALKPSLIKAQTASDADFFLGTQPSPGVGDNASTAQRIINAENATRNPYIKNPNSAAAGLGQFMPETWIDTVKKYAPEVARGKTDDQILAMRTDGTPAGIAFSERMTGAYAGESADALQKAGLPTDPGSVYLGYVLGPGGAVKALASGAPTPIKDVVPANVITANKWNPDWTVRQLHSWASGRMGASTGDPQDFDQAMARARQELAGQPDRLKRAITEIKARQSEFHQETASDREQILTYQQNALIGIERGEQDPDTTKVYSYEEMRAVDIPEAKARAIADEYAIVKEVGPIFKAVKTDTPDELAKTIDDMKNGTGAFAMVAGPEHSILRDNLTARLGKVIKERNDSINADVADWAIKNSPVASAAWNKVQTLLHPDPGSAPGTTAEIGTAFQQYAATMRGIESHLGVAPNKQSLLTVQQSKDMVEGLMNLPADQRVTAMHQMHDMYAGEWESVFASLVRDGKLPQSLQLIPLTDDPVRGSALTMMLDRDNAEKAITAVPQGDRDAVDKEVDDQLKPLQKSMPRAPATFAGYKRAVQMMAYGLVYQGMDPTVAAKAAAATVTSDKYTFLPDGSRIPKGRPDIEAQSINIVRHLTAPQLEPLNDPYHTGLTIEQRQEMALDNARNGFWLTNEMDNGLVRYGRDGQPIRTTDGKVVEFYFGDRPAEQRPETMQPPGAVRANLPGPQIIPQLIPSPERRK